MSGTCETVEIEAKVVTLGKFTPAPGCKKLTSNQEKLLRTAIEKEYSEKKQTTCNADCLCIMGSRKKEATGVETVSVEASPKNSNCTYTGSPKIRFTTYVTKGRCVRKKISGVQFSALSERDEILMDIISVAMQNGSPQDLLTVADKPVLQPPTRSGPVIDNATKFDE